MCLDGRACCHHLGAYLVVVGAGRTSGEIRSRRVPYVLLSLGTLFYRSLANKALEDFPARTVTSSAPGVECNALGGIGFVRVEGAARPISDGG